MLKLNTSDIYHLNKLAEELLQTMVAAKTNTHKLKQAEMLLMKFMQLLGYRFI